MKSEHRHDLKTNELGRIVAQATPFLEKYSNYILVGLGLAVVIGGAAIFISSSSSGSTAGWNSMFAARSVEDYASIADKYPGKPVSAWARLNEAQSYYENGTQESFTDRASAISDLKKAADIFKELVNDNSVAREVRERALFGLARTTEATSDGNTEPAIQLYEQLAQLAQDPKDSNGLKPVFQQLAEDRIEVLRSERAKDFYAWFHKQDPKPADRAQPNDAMGLPPGHPPLGEITLPPIPKQLRLPNPNTDAASPPKDAGASSPPAADPADATPADAKKDAGKQQPAADSETKPKADSAEKQPKPSE